MSKKVLMSAQHDSETEKLVKERQKIIASLETVNEVLPNARTKEDKNLLKRQKKIFTERLQHVNDKLKVKGREVNNFIREILAESFDKEKMRLLLEEANNRVRHGIAKPFPLVFMTDKDQEQLESVKQLQNKLIASQKHSNDLQQKITNVRMVLMSRLETEADFTLRKVYSEILKQL